MRANPKTTIAAAAAMVVFGLARNVFRASLGCGLHAVRRRSHGEAYFTASVGILFAFYHVAPGTLQSAAYVLPLAVLTISDAAAALVGSRFGKHLFSAGDAIKSWEGVAAFAATAFPISCITLGLLTSLNPIDVVLASVAVTGIGAAIEALSTRGLDNLFIPLGLYAALASSTANGVDRALLLEYVAISALVLMALAGAGPARRVVGSSS